MNCIILIIITSHFQDNTPLSYNDSISFNADSSAECRSVAAHKAYEHADYVGLNQAYSSKIFVGYTFNNVAKAFSVRVQ